ncbi:MAG TPA: HD domain-containing protein, partial [Planctomycetia bacterium]|nr:HD domain-containing protein [Planctomycetia bacterium]
GMLAVERFMRDCLRRTTAVADVAERFADRNRRSAGWRAMLGAFTARVLEPGVQLQAGRLELSPETRAAACASLEKLLELAALAASHGACFDPATAEALRARTRVDGETNAPVSAAASASFLQMLSHSGGANRIVRQLHQTGALAAVLPEFERIRCLIQFNAYHRYTVDEHTLVMLEKVESFGANGRGDAPARGYARVRRRELLHLAVLLHDLGKGVDEDHSEVGMRIAHAASDRLGLSGADRRTLVFLVHKHLLLSRLAFQRDTRDPAVLLQLVRAVGREEMLHKLYCLTVADVMAVSPEAYTQWKADLLEDLYRRALAWFGEGGEAGEGALEAPTAPEIAGFDGDEEAKSWLLLLPAERLRSLSAGELKELGAARRRLAAEGVVTLFRYDPARDAATLTVLTHESLTGGIFHKICGALAAHHLEVLAAHIHTFAGGGVLDVFEVRDIHHTGAPSPERRQRISATVARVLKGELTVDDALWSSRSSLFVARTRVIPSDSIRIEIDNESCADCTIVDVFAHDRRGLLYTQARTLFKLGLSITFAKIATYSDEVVDVFYLRDSEGRKIEADEDCQRIRTEMTRALERLATDPRSMGF